MHNECSFIHYDGYKLLRAIWMLCLDLLEWRSLMLCVTVILTLLFSGFSPSCTLNNYNQVQGRKQQSLNFSMSCGRLKVLQGHISSSDSVKPSSTEVNCCVLLLKWNALIWSEFSSFHLLFPYLNSCLSLYTYWQVSVCHEGLTTWETTVFPGLSHQIGRHEMLHLRYIIVTVVRTWMTGQGGVENCKIRAYELLFCCGLFLSDSKKQWSAVHIYRKFQKKKKIASDMSFSSNGMVERLVGIKTVNNLLTKAGHGSTVPHFAFILEVH